MITEWQQHGVMMDALRERIEGLTEPGEESSGT